MSQASVAGHDKNNEIEILRAASIIFVLFGHLPYPIYDILIHGYTGVTLFFVISGYVVTKSFISSRSAVDPVKYQLANFYVRRVFRILPSAILWVGLYFMIAQAVTALGGAYGSLDRWQREIGWFFSGIYNYKYAYSRGSGLFGQYWSLFVEMHFYLVIPVVLLMLKSQAARDYFCIVGILAVWLIARPYTDPAFAGVLTHSQSDALLLGVLIAVLLPSSPRASVLPEGQMTTVIKITTFATLAVILWLLPASFDYTLTPTFKYPIFVALSGALVYLAHRNENWISFHIPAVNRFMVYIGSRAYSIYVCHVILYSCLYHNLYTMRISKYPEIVNRIMGNQITTTIFLFAVTLVVAELSYRLIEAPFIELGKRFLRRPPAFDTMSSKATA